MRRPISCTSGLSNAFREPGRLSGCQVGMLWLIAVPTLRVVTQGFRNTVILIQPVSQIDESTAFTAEWPPGGVR